jgi:xanthine dehydrogenase accessory factor
MTDWLAVIARLSGSGVPCILITVAETRGSVPREAGAKMVVTEDAADGTIGGGQLEYEALHAAREMLAGNVTAQLRRFGLGPSLGQCCGGAAKVLFERITDPAEGWLTALMEWIGHGEPAVLVSAIGDPVVGKLVVSSDVVAGALGDARHHAGAVAAARTMLEAADAGVRLEEGEDGGVLLFEPIRPDGLHVVLFGAGHVGKALVQVLGQLQCRVTWVDGRPEQFPREVPPNVTVECTEMPQYAVERAPAGAAFLVMTHSHALDLTLCEKILRRNDFAYFGLIGSATKRAKFTKRLEARGLPDEVTGRMVCPIGIPGLSGKHPGEIAVAVAAELLMVCGKQGQRDAHVPDPGRAIAGPHRTDSPRAWRRVSART